MLCYLLSVKKEVFTKAIVNFVNNCFIILKEGKESMKKKRHVSKF